MFGQEYEIKDQGVTVIVLRTGELKTLFLFL